MVLPCTRGSTVTTLERRPAERCPAERCPAERCPAERCPAERCPAERCPAERRPADVVRFSCFPPPANTISAVAPISTTTAAQTTSQLARRLIAPLVARRS